jgi:hypothetical protein
MSRTRSLCLESIESIESFNESDIDTTATELLGLWEFVVESYELDEVKQESIFHCRIQLDYAICPGCRCVSGDIHQYKRRRVRDMMCFEQSTCSLIFVGFDVPSAIKYSLNHWIALPSIIVTPDVSSKWSIESVWDKHLLMRLRN